MKNGVADSPRGGEELPPTSREGSGPTPGRGARAGPGTFGDPVGPAYQRGFFTTLGEDERLVEMACCGFRYSDLHEDSTTGGYTCPLCVPDDKPSLLAGPESAAEHLRNAVMILNAGIYHREGVDVYHIRSKDVEAVRRRVVAALAQLDA